MTLPLFQKRSSAPKSLLGWYLSTSGDLPGGYMRLIDAPEVCACIDRIAAIAASATIYLRQNSKDGDVRVKNALSRFVDVDPWPGMGTRQSWVTWIVSTMLGDGDGNAFVLPHTSGGLLTALEPMPDAVMIPDVNGASYSVQWRGRTYLPDEILHFRLFADPKCPWKGRGYRVQAKQIAESLQQTDRLKKTLSSPAYKPPLIVAVNSDDDLASDEKREAFRKKFLEDSDHGKPWILPADLVKVQQTKPLTLTDLAVKDTVDLDKRSVASVFGVPPFLLGLGAFNEKEYAAFIRGVVIPICTGIEQELTLKLLLSDQMYFEFSRRRLYSYDLKTLIDIDLAMSDRGFVTGDEVRETAYRDPAGLNEFRPLENYIPYDLAGNQNKLNGGNTDE